MSKKGFGLSLSGMYNLVQLFYWLGGCVCVGFAAAFLQERGLNNTTIGMVSAASSAVAFFLMMGVSTWIDRKGTGTVFKALYLSVSLQSILMVIILLPGISPTLVATAYSLYLALSFVLSTIVSKLYLDLSKGGVNINFGVARGVGSLGYGIGSMILGYLLARTHSFSLLLTGHLFFVVLALLFYRISRFDIKQPETTYTINKTVNHVTILPLLREAPFFFVLVLGIAIVSSANKTVTLFLVNIVHGVGGNMKNFGAVSGYLALLEVPVIFLFSRMRKKWSVSSLLFASLIFYTLKIGGYCLAGSVTALLAASSFQAFSTGLFQPASVEYIRDNIPHENSATANSLISGMPLLFSFFATIYFGNMLDQYNVHHTLRVLLFMAVFGAIVSGLSMLLQHRKTICLR